MKRTLTIGLLASAAAFVLATATPSLAQQRDYMRANAAANQAYQQNQAGRYSTAQYYYGPAARGYRAYAYVPGGPGSLNTCATQGTYGQGLDVSACGGE
jgi:hypothetical protein